MTEGDFDTFPQFLKNFKPDPYKQLVRYREGGDPDDFSVPGGYKYTPTSGFFQVGSTRWTGGATTSGSVVFTFPQAYRDKPLLLATPIATTPANQEITCLAVIDSASNCTIYWWSAVNLTVADFHWLAFGPAGA